MNIENNSIVGTVIDYANVKFGVELSKEQVASQLKNIGFSDMLNLVNSIKDEDNDQFLDYINISVEEAYGTISTNSPSAATIRSQSTKDTNAQRADKNISAKAMRTGGADRSVAGGNKTATGQGTPTTDEPEPEMDMDAVQTDKNTSEIQRLKQLISRKD